MKSSPPPSSSYHNNNNKQTPKKSNFTLLSLSLKFRATMRHLIIFIFILVLASSTFPVSLGHNITRILAEHPEFSTFNHYLTITHLASEINRRQTLTVLVLSNAAISPLLHLPLPTLKNLLSLHILVDYFGAKKLHQITSGTALASTFFQSSGDAPGTAGFVNITDHRAGHVTFSADGSDVQVSFVRSVKEIPYNLSVVQISAPLNSPVAEAPTPAASQIDFVSTMAKKGTKQLICAATRNWIFVFVLLLLDYFASKIS